MKKEGIREHSSLGVEPQPIEICPNGEPIKMEKGFTFEIPKDKRESLKKTFLNMSKNKE